MEKQDVSRAARTIRSLMREKKYKDVVKLAKSLRLDRINNGLLILDIVEAYEKLGEKKEAKNTLLNYYDVHGITGRNMMQKLIELCIETRDIRNAVGLCMEFENEWPESSISYLMRYQITTSAGGNLEERIYYLEKYKETEFEERWGYELAKLYDKNNQPQQCAAICHEIICFFGHGKYVEKAVQLKERVAGLTADEIDILEAVKRREEEIRIKQEEEERLAKEEAERLRKEEEERLAEQEKERLAREEEERLRREEIERQEREKAERLEKEKAERFMKEDVHLNSKETEVNDIEPEAEQGAEDAAVRKAREAEFEKIRQTEEAARMLKEKKEEERIAREQKIAQAFKTSDRYAEIEKRKAEGIYFEEFSEDREKKEEKQKRSQSGGIFSSFGRVASDIRKTLQPDEEYMEDTSSEIQYITVGRDSQAYVQDIEERMLSELDMLDDEQINELTSGQIKEIYELKVLRDVRESIKELIDDIDDVYHVETSKEELERFIKKDPYPSLMVSSEERVEPHQEPPDKPKEKSDEEDQEEPEEIKKEISEESPEEPEETEKEILEESREEPEGTEKEISEESPEEPEETEKEIPEESPEEPEGTEKEISEESPEEPEESEKEIPEEIPEEPEGTEKEISEESPEEPEGTEKEILEESREEPEESEKEIPEEIPEEPEESEKEILEESPEEPEKSQGDVKEAEKKETILDRIEEPDGNLTIKEFSECITAYAETKGYQVEDTAYMTIAVLAEQMQQQDTPLSLENAKKMIDDAIARIQKRNPLDKIMDRCSKKRAYLLKDRHFYWKSERS